MRELHISRSITNRESPSVEKYLNEIGKISLISGDEEADLARRIRNGDKAALERLVKSNLRFVVSVAKKYQNNGLSLNDLISEGNVGLIRAAHKFDETRGFKFISCAVWWIRQSMLEAIATQSRMIRLPMNQIGAITRINRAVAKFEQVAERLPTPEELEELASLNREKITDALHYAPHTQSYDAPFAHSADHYSVLDIAPSEDGTTDHRLLESSFKVQIDLLLGTLPHREKRIIELSYGLTSDRAMEPKGIGKVIGLSTERVRQLRNIALQKIQQQYRFAENY
jgi:RNA polymerase primary sigma factor